MCCVSGLLQLGVFIYMHYGVISAAAEAGCGGLKRERLCGHNRLEMLGVREIALGIW